jgi:hypothetical protein
MLLLASGLVKTKHLGAAGVVFLFELGKTCNDGQKQKTKFRHAEQP